MSASCGATVYIRSLDIVYMNSRLFSYFIRTFPSYPTHVVAWETLLEVAISRIPLQMSYTLAKTCLFCIPSHFVARCKPFRSGNQRHRNLVAEHELRHAATRICRKTCMYAHTRCDTSLRPKSRDMYAGVY